MSKLSFVYCFSKNLAVDEKQYAASLELFQISAKLLGEFYNFRIITDNETISDVEHFSKNIEIVDTSKFVFLDDFKISLLEKLAKDEILVDPDIIMKKQPTIRIDSDVVFDYKDSPTENWYTEEINDLAGTLLYNRIKEIPTLPFIPNIGFLKINNTTLLSEYIRQYKMFSKDIVDKLKFPFPKFSILLGQYLLGILLYEGNYSYFSIRSENTGKVYVHLGGEQKYQFLNRKQSVI